MMLDALVLGLKSARGVRARFSEFWMPKFQRPTVPCLHLQFLWMMVIILFRLDVIVDARRFEDRQVTTYTEVVGSNFD
jgi:hypothetical protein